MTKKSPFPFRSIQQNWKKSKNSQDAKFTSFTGAARRLDGKAVASIPIRDCPPVRKEQEPAGATTDAGSSDKYSSKHGKLVFDSSVAEARNASRKLL